MNRKPPRLSIPRRAHPLVKRLFYHMKVEEVSLMEMSRKSGINKNTLKDWRTRTDPTVSNLEACFNVLGLSLKPVEMNAVDKVIAYGSPNRHTS